jgi:hypothetical protein
MRIRLVTAVLGLAIGPSIGAAELAQARSARSAQMSARRTPAHNLQEARRALERAWRKADAPERERLGPLRTHFAELVVAYTKLPTDPKGADAALSAEPTRSSGGGVPDRPPPGAPTGSNATVPPATSGAIPHAAISTKPPLEWQARYAVVEADLKGLEPEASNPVLKNRLDHFRTHLQMFYATALGRPSR